MIGNRSELRDYRGSTMGSYSWRTTEGLLQVLFSTTRIVEITIWGNPAREEGARMALEGRAR